MRVCERQRVATTLAAIEESDELNALAAFDAVARVAHVAMVHHRRAGARPQHHALRVLGEQLARCADGRDGGGGGRDCTRDRTRGDTPRAAERVHHRGSDAAVLIATLVATLGNGGGRGGGRVVAVERALRHGQEEATRRVVGDRGGERDVDGQFGVVGMLTELLAALRRRGRARAREV